MELWQLLVFGSERARGNPTGVLLNPPHLDSAECQDIACRLGFPDTIFVWPDVMGWKARAFSPSEEVSFCIQALLGAAAVLRKVHPTLPASPISLSMGERLVSVTSTSSGQSEVHWLAMPDGRMLENALALDHFIQVPPLGEPEVVVDAGRRRLYRLLESVQDLEEVVVPPEHVMRYCRAADIHGICLLAINDEETARMRVFTTSLDGHEDAATGGAASAVPQYLAQTGRVQGLSRTWVVQQGAGPAHRRGTLYVSEANGATQVGGLVQFVARGQLVH